MIVPVPLGRHCEWRADLMEGARNDRELQAGLRGICTKDVVFFFSAFVWTFDPRIDTSQKQPFIPYPMQVDYILAVQEAIKRGTDLNAAKARDSGASWGALGVLAHGWLFSHMMHFVVTSRTEELVDATDSPASLFWKLGYIVDNLPSWLRGNYQAKKHKTHRHMYNPDTEGVIDGVSPGKDAGRAGRCTAFLADEHAHIEDADGMERATADSTSCRIRISTPNGTGNAFYRHLSQGNNTIILPWWLHPRKINGIYKTVDGETVILDKDFEGMVRCDPSGAEVYFPQDYHFQIDLPENEGKYHSPWYDVETLRRGSEQDMAQEVDLDFQKSGGVFFDVDRLLKHQVEFVQDAWCSGEVMFKFDYDTKRVAFQRFARDHGRRRMHLWCLLDDRGYPSWDTNYVISIDPSNGRSKANSIITISDCESRRKVGEWACPETAPEELSRVAVAIAQWFRGEFGQAYMIWESNGSGAIFGKSVLELGHRHIYFHRDELSDRPNETERPGFFTSRQSKHLLLGEYRRALNRADYINPCKDSIREALDYIYYRDGGIGPSTLSENTIGIREAHGDRVIADALGVRGLAEQPRAAQHSMKAPGFTHSSRRQLYDRKRKSADPWAPHPVS